MKVNIANVLTVTRLILTPFFIACFVADVKLWAFVIFCVASFTDLIDGTVARLQGQHSKWGALLDPIADKLLMQGCFVLLFFAGFLPWWFFLMALARDIMIIGGIIYLEVKKAKLPYRAIWPSKFGTLFQMMVAGFALLRWWFPKTAEAQAGLELTQMIFMVIAAALIVISGYQYVCIGLGILRQKDGS